MTAPDFGAVLAALDDHEVSYVVIGAVALAAHGPVRATEDVDLVPDPDPENLRHLGNALVALDARLTTDANRGIDPELREALAAGRSLTLETPFAGVDVVQRLPGVPAFAELASEAEHLTVLGYDVSVCSRRHLREMKLARGSHRDLADIEDLDETQ